MAAGALAAQPEPPHDRQVVADGDMLLAQRAMAGRIDERNAARHTINNHVIEAPDARTEGKKHD